MRRHVVIPFKEIANKVNNKKDEQDKVETINSDDLKKLGEGTWTFI
jgi:hypothetical protein